MWTVLLVLAAVAALTHGHGRVLDPPGRSTMWRFGFPTRRNDDDHSLNCGGRWRQHDVNGGKCGICGDPYDSREPRNHELGGIYGSGIIGATYRAGDVISITVQITVYHKGYWEFKLCPDPNSNEQACFDQYFLELEQGGTKYYLDQGANTYVVNYKLPPGLTSDHCVLQWRYTTGNNKGFCADGSETYECGAQETFGACSDIAIIGNY